MVYDPKKVNVIIDNVTVTGFAESSLVTCERNEDRMTPHVSVKGEHVFARNGNDSGTITITLQHTSPMNSKLTKLSKAGRTFPISVLDLNTGGFRAGGNEAMILTEPAIERGKEVTEREWAIYVGDYDVFE